MDKNGQVIETRREPLGNNLYSSKQAVRDSQQPTRSNLVEFMQDVTALLVEMMESRMQKKGNREF